jgi:hypothetical protein
VMFMLPNQQREYDVYVNQTSLHRFVLP